MPKPRKTIDQFISENPQYKNRDPEELARKIYDDVYSDMPYDEYLSIVLPTGEVGQPKLLGNLPPGTDLTAGSGILQGATGLVREGVNVLRDAGVGSPDYDFLKDEEIMTERVKALGSLAAITLLDSISIRENQTLLKMVTDMQIKPVKGLVFGSTDSSTLSKLEAADATIDFMSNIIEQNIDGGNLNRSEKAKERKTLNQVKSLKAEYAPLIEAYRRKLDVDGARRRSPEAVDPLDTFFE
tara:strand:- start:5194 stop:5916 length:723 start_codon:yes stop_codon:yes gene_type:complete